MEINLAVVFLTITVCLLGSSQGKGIFRRCFQCRSRGELGSCKDPFTFNATQVESEPGVEAVPCASKWCGKILETENAFKEEYGVATQRLCLQRGPSDGEDRCAYTLYNHKKVYMCFCQGDLCNSSNRLSVSVAMSVSLLLFLYLK